MRHMIGLLIDMWQPRPVYRPHILSYRTPEPPMGFVPRSDPNYYFLARKF
jgi:hypothetical protein